MALRSARERALQTLSYEAGGLLLATPLYAALAGGGTRDGMILVAALAGAVMIWSPLHNTVFDWIEWRLAQRVASDRPQVWRLVHALSHEASSVVVTLPVILWLTDHGIGAALLVDLGLTLFYAGYAYLFHLGYDRLRPVLQQVGQPVSGQGVRPAVRETA